jgi:hypothetical protein
MKHRSQESEEFVGFVELLTPIDLPIKSCLSVGQILVSFMQLHLIIITSNDFSVPSRRSAAAAFAASALQ